MTTARRYLFVTWEGGGNVPPVLGLARRLRDRGHEVHVLGEPCLSEPMDGAGCDFTAFTRHFVRTDRSADLIGDWEAKSPPAALKRALARVLFGPARIVAEETRAAIERVQPDVVVADIMMPGALLAAEALGVPRVVLCHMPEYLPGPGKPASGPGLLPRNDWIGRMRDRILTALFHRLLAGQVGAFNDARAAMGLSPVAGPAELLDTFHSADLRLIQTSRAFDFPIDPAPPNVRYVGPVLDEPDWAGEWTSPWASEDPRPLVVASLSTTFQNQAAVLGRIIEALGALPVRGLVTVGPALDGRRFELPENVVAVRSAPHGRVFPSAAAVVTHAGHGTVMRALAHGVPLVCIPMGRDQVDNAAKVVARGAGLRLKAAAAPDRIRQAVRRVLDEPSFRAGALRLQRAIVSDVEAERGVAELEGIAIGAGVS